MFRKLASSVEFLKPFSKEDSTVTNERNISTIAMWTPPQPLTRSEYLIVITNATVLSQAIAKVATLRVKDASVAFKVLDVPFNLLSAVSGPCLRSLSCLCNRSYAQMYRR
jgi:hypothetical protein